MKTGFTFSDDAKLLRRAVYQGFLEQGHSFATAELMQRTGLDPERLETAMAELERGLMVMCPPGAHDVAKCPPWTNVPSRHAVEIGSRHACYAGCALEAMNIAWCYPGQEVTIRTSCPETGATIAIRLKENRVLDVSPATSVGHTGVDPARWSENWFHACAHNNFFSSPEAVARWEARHPEHSGVMLNMEQLSRFAHYTYRLDYERGADPNNPRDGETMFGSLGVPIPDHWTRLIPR